MFKDSYFAETNFKILIINVTWFQYAGRCFRAKWQKYKANKAKRTASWIASNQFVNGSVEQSRIWDILGHNRRPSLELGGSTSDIELGRSTSDVQLGLRQNSAASLFDTNPTDAGKCQFLKYF
jgi:hypothetical protein